MNQKLSLAHQQMTADYEKMRQEEADISAKLQERMSVAKSGTRGLKHSRGLSSGGGGDDLIISSCAGDDRVVEGEEDRRVSMGGLVDGVKKDVSICDREIVTEEDKRRLFDVIMNAKRRKEMLNLTEKQLREIQEDGECEDVDGGQKDHKNSINSRRTTIQRRRGSSGSRRKVGLGDKGAVEVVASAAKKRNFRGLVRDVLEQLPFALPTLQLHIILSLTMVLLTHQCPVASYFIAV